MKINKVWPHHIDESHARVLEVRTTKGTFNTPLQIVNQSEANCLRAEDGTNHQFQLIQIQWPFDREKLRNLKNDGAHLNNLEKYWSKRCDGYLYKMCIPIPDPAIKEFSYEDISFIVSMQIDSGMDTGFYPCEPVSAPQFSLKLDRLREENEGSGSEIIPILDLAESSSVFKAKFRHLIDAGYPGVSLWHQGVVKSRANLFYTKQRAKDLQMWITLANYRPVFSEDVPASWTHLFPWYGIDSYVKKSYPYPAYLLQNGELPPRNELSIRFFGKKSLGILDKNQFAAEAETLRDCSCSSTHGTSIETLFDGGTERAARLSKIHNLIDGQTALDQMREPIRENRLSKYLKGKKYALKTIPFDSFRDLSL